MRKSRTHLEALAWFDKFDKTGGGTMEYTPHPRRLVPVYSGSDREQHRRINAAFAKRNRKNARRVLECVS